MKKTWFRFYYNIKRLFFCISSIVFGNLMFIILLLSIVTSYFLYNHQDILSANNKAESIIAIILLYTGIIYNLVTYKIANDQFFKSLFSEFNCRFDKMNEALNAIIKKEYKKNEIYKKDEESVIIDYLNLCAEEYLWFTKGRIETQVWKSWKKGMEHYLMQETFKKIVEEQREEKNSYYGLFDLIDNKFK
jgi:hypothetical protein